VRIGVGETSLGRLRIRAHVPAPSAGRDRRLFLLVAGEIGSCSRRDAFALQMSQVPSDQPLLDVVPGLQAM
jgi:hypothetical protein